MNTRVRSLALAIAALAMVAQAHAGDRPPSTGGGNPRPPSTGEACNNASSDTAQLFINAPGRFTALESASNWSEIDTLYRSLDDKARPGTTFCLMTGLYHLAGGKAALNRGEIGVARVRFQRGTASNAPGATAFVAMIDATFAPVNIESQPGSQQLTLTRPAHMGLTDPIAISAFTRGKVALQNNRRFTGWLPLGPYTIEPLGKVFMVVPNPSTPLIVN